MIVGPFSNWRCPKCGRVAGELVPWPLRLHLSAKVACWGGVCCAACAAFLLEAVLSLEWGWMRGRRPPGR